MVVEIDQSFLLVMIQVGNTQDRRITAPPI